MPPAKKQRVAATADDAISIASSSSGKSRAGGTPSSSSSIEIIEPRRSARVAKVAQAQKDAPPSPSSTASGSTSRIKRAIKPRASRTVLTRADYEAPIFEDDGDVVMDDDFAMALRYQSPELEFDKAMYGGEEYDGDGTGFVESVVKSGLSLWVADTKVCEGLVGPAGWVLEGYAGMEGTVLDLKGDEKEMSIKFRLAFEDMDGSSFTYALLILFTNLSTYPKTCDTLIQAPAPPPIRRSHQKIFERFTTIHDLPLQRLITRLLCAFQGDDDANGGKPEEVLEDDEEYDEGLVGFDDDDELGQIGRGFEVAQGCHGDLGKDWGRVKVEFLQAKSRGYRPGLTKISDYWVVSYSIPLKSMDIDPNELAIWDDDLVEAWEDDMRFILLMRMDKYGASYADTKWALTLDKDYKPSDEEISRQTVTRRRGPAPRHPNSTTHPELPPRTFFLSDALTSHLKVFPRCYQLRVSYPLTWDSADRYGMDDAEISQIFDEQKIPINVGDCILDPADPIELGLTENLPLVAFYWICRRFTKAPKYCLNCGVGVQVEGRRPYVCDKALCLYGMMSLGLGPSLSHTIQTHPGVVDLLLSFAHAAASSTTRMDSPSGINIDVPPSSGLCETSTPLDDLPEPERRRALVYLIESLPRISFIAAHLNSGLPLSDLYSSMHPGAMTVLRWTVGTCRAYLKETRAGEGVVNDQSAPVAATPNYGAGVVSANIRQFSFVVGDPEQEEAFAEEIREARKVKPSLGKYPTMLAFHGSGAERWHNILRTGLDFNEISCGRAYGNGVYFAADSGISMGSYARPNTTRRPNADFAITRATALCELVNVPETFVSRQPYYVINKVKQIKPFLLLVEGIAAPPIVPPPKPPLGPDGEIAMTVTQDPADVVVPPVKMERKRSGGAGERRFLHDPTLQLKATYFQRPLEVNMPEKIARATFIDTQPDTPSDAALYKSPIIGIPDSPPPIRKSSYTPATEEFYKQITMLPPPSATSPRATKAIMRELKAVMKAQKEGVLPFWLVPDSDRLHSWTLELFEFDDDSILKKEMKKLGIKSMIAELRFGASFPASPPFMRIIYPRCLPFASGGGGNITAGGSVCNEILTTSGWNPTFCMEAMIRDIMLNMTAADRPARIDPHRWQMPYGIHEAVEAYKRVATHHGWEIPKDFEQMALT